MFLGSGHFRAGGVRPEFGADMEAVSLGMLQPAPRCARPALWGDQIIPDAPAKELVRRRPSNNQGNGAHSGIGIPFHGKAAELRGIRMFQRISHSRYLAVLGLLFAVVFAVCAVRPWHFNDWVLENVLTIGAVAAIAAFRKRLCLSRISYSLIFVFLCLHEVGAHYTYAEVPYDAWFRAATGRSFSTLFGWERNHFDRLVHFCYGLLLAYPIREVFLRVANVRGFWGYFFPLNLTMSTSMLYELIEWAAAGTFGGELGQAYLGTQGDIWDAHKDMGLASLGALIAMFITAGLNLRFQRDFAREWNRSLQVKGQRPLGEDELVRLMRADCDR
jgi:putative membrane protein